MDVKSIKSLAFYGYFGNKLRPVLTTVLH